MSSSPALGPADSSPPSSPPPGLLLPGAPLAHPFAASTKAVRRLPSYEKKPPSAPATSALRPAAGRCRGAPASALQEHGQTPPPTHPDRDERIWDDALRRPFDTGIGQIDLSNHQLKSIPPSIRDLAGFFNTTQSSEQTLLPARVFASANPDPARARSFDRTQSIKDSGKERHVLKLYLMGNSISSLPPELFTVNNLTVLSLRGNRLACIPPEICRLTNLHELNISNNRLKFLPWQMRDMTIQRLLVHPNPFLPEPSRNASNDDPSHSPPRTPRSISGSHSLRRDVPAAPPKPLLSPVTLSLSHVPPLTELCFRLLLAPSETARMHTVITEYYGLPLSDQWTIPPSVRRALMGTVPGILRPRKRLPIDTTTPEDPPSTSTGSTTGMCPNPAHKGRVFVKHASERFSWERRVAGADVGGAVPLRWRGCLVACLDFLDHDAKEGAIDWPSGHAPTSGRGEDSDADFEMAVQAIDLGHVRLDMGDFDD